jgi:hypothetical protein
MISSSVRLPNLAIVAIACIALSCVGNPKPNATTTPNADARPSANAASEPSAHSPGQATNAGAFDPTMVTESVKNAAFVDVRALIESLNQIIRKKDYDGWLSCLTDEYINFYSNPDFLAKNSEYPILKRKGIKLITLKDYFVNVVYPSHQNDEIDDIEFVGENIIKAITVNPKGERNILYMLEKHGDAWKIGIGR